MLADGPKQRGVGTREGQTARARKPNSAERTALQPRAPSSEHPRGGLLGGLLGLHVTPSLPGQRSPVQPGRRTRDPAMRGAGEPPGAITGLPWAPQAGASGVLRWDLGLEQALHVYSGPGRLLPAPKATASHALCTLATSSSTLTGRRPGPRRCPERTALSRSGHLSKPQHGVTRALEHLERLPRLPLCPRALLVSGKHLHPVHRARPTPTPSLCPAPASPEPSLPHTLFSPLSPLQEIVHGAHIQGPGKCLPLPCLNPEPIDEQDTKAGGKGSPKGHLSS